MKLKDLYEKRAAIYKEMQALTTADTLEAEKWEKMDKEFEELTKSIAAIEKVEKMESEFSGQKQDEKPTDKKVNRAWANLILNYGDLTKISPEEQAIIRTAQQSTTVGAGGYTIPQGFSGELAQAELFYNNFYDFCRVIRTDSGNDMPWPKNNDTGVVAYQLGEAVNAETSATALTFTSQTLKAWKWTSGMVRVSAELLQDSAFNMQTLLLDLFAERMGRGLNAAFTTGVGTTTIQGAVVGATSAALSGVAATAITRDNVLDLIHSVDVAYRRKPSFRLMFADSTLKALRKLDQGDNSSPLYQVSAIAGVPDTIDGVRFEINNNMAAIAASAKSMLAGDFANYVIRQVNGDVMKVLTERFADTDEIGLVLFRRIDAQVVDAGTNPIKYLTHTAS